MANKFVEPLAAALYSLFYLCVNNELELCRFREVRAGGVCAGRAEVDLVGSERRENKLVHAECGGSVHTRVLSKESGDAIIVYDDYHEDEQMNGLE